MADRTERLEAAAPLRVTLLDRMAAQRYAPTLAALDAALCAELGAAYSHLRWREEHFLRDLPGKWALSHVALLAEDVVAGFWVASGGGADAHTHRVGVARAHRQRGIGLAMFRAVRAAALQRRHRRLVLTVSATNPTANRFYEHLGFTRLRGLALARFVHAHGRAGTVIGDEIEETLDGARYRYWAWALDLEPTCA